MEQAVKPTVVYLSGIAHTRGPMHLRSHPMLSSSSLDMLVKQGLSLFTDPKYVSYNKGGKCSPKISADGFVHDYIACRQPQCLVLKRLLVMLRVNLQIQCSLLCFVYEVL